MFTRAVRVKKKKQNSSIQGARVIIDALTVTLPPPGAPRRDAFTITGSVGAASYMLPTFRKLAVVLDVERLD